MRFDDSKLKHVADVYESDILKVTLDGVRGEMLRLDCVALCGRELVESEGLIIIMRTAAVNCAGCRRRTGITAVKKGLLEMGLLEMKEPTT